MATKKKNGRAAKRGTRQSAPSPQQMVVDTLLPVALDALKEMAKPAERPQIVMSTTITEDPVNYHVRGKVSAALRNQAKRQIDDGYSSHSLYGCALLVIADILDPTPFRKEPATATMTHAE